MHYRDFIDLAIRAEACSSGVSDIERFYRNNPGTPDIRRYIRKGMPPCDTAWAVVNLLDWSKWGLRPNTLFTLFSDGRFLLDAPDLAAVCREAGLRLSAYSVTSREWHPSAFRKMRAYLLRHF